MNLHSSGNYFMWSPGAYATPGADLRTAADLGRESFFWGASTHILTAIKRHRNMAVTPGATGPISDVLYSAAGNSGDMLWYKYGIFAWNFEVGTALPADLGRGPQRGDGVRQRPGRADARGLRLRQGQPAARRAGCR